MIPILNMARRYLAVGDWAAENRLDVIAIRVKDECSDLRRPDAPFSIPPAFSAAALKASTSAMVSAAKAVCSFTECGWNLSIQTTEYSKPTPSIPESLGICMARRIPSAPKAAS
jgi:hypothetical protein